MPDQSTPTGDPPNTTDHAAISAQILDYIAQHRGQYTLIALRQQLLAAGYPNTIVDEVLRSLDGGTTSKGGVPAPPLGFLVALLNGVLIALLGTLLDPVAPDGSSYLYVAGALVLGELGLWLALRNGPRALLGRILLWGVLWSAIVVAVVIALGLLLFGLCIALLGGLGG